MEARRSNNKSHFLGSEIIPQLLVSPSDGTWREEMVALERHDLIGWFFAVWLPMENEHSSRPKKWLEPELAVLEVGSGRDIQIVLPQYRNNVRERGLQALLTWVHAIRYTLRVFCACFQRKKRIKKCNSKMVHRFILIYSTLPASACSVRHFNAHLKFLSLDRGHNAFNL